MGAPLVAGVPMPGEGGRRYRADEGESGVGGAGGTAGDVLALVVADHVRRIEQRTPAAVADEPDGVHALRTGVRRLRNVLAVYRKAFDADAVARLRGLLAELGAVLGEARDLEVRTAQLQLVRAELSDDAAPELVARMTRELQGDYRLAHDRVTRWCVSPRHADLTEVLVRWAADPPLGAWARKPGAEAVRTRLGRQADRVAAVGAELDAGRLAAPWSATAAHGLAAAHEARKAARRLAHAAGAVTDEPAALLGDDARALGEAGSRLQTVLGAHRDAMMLAAHAARLAAGREGDRGSFDAVVEGAKRLARAALTDLVPAVAGLQAARDGFVVGR